MLLRYASSKKVGVDVAPPPTPATPNTIETSAFPELKYADVKPVAKNDYQTNKKNYRLISILPNVSKIYERCINKQLEEYFQALISKYQCCCFSKGYSVIKIFLPMTEKWRTFLDTDGALGALLTNYSINYSTITQRSNQ